MAFINLKNQFLKGNLVTSDKNNSKQSSTERGQNSPAPKKDVNESSKASDKESTPRGQISPEKEPDPGDEEGQEEILSNGHTFRMATREELEGRSNTVSSFITLGAPASWKPK